MQYSSSDLRRGGQLLAIKTSSAIHYEKKKIPVSQRVLLSLTLYICSPRELAKKAPTPSAAHLPQGRLVTERVFSRLHDKGETRRKRLIGFRLIVNVGSGVVIALVVMVVAVALALVVVVINVGYCHGHW